MGKSIYSFKKYSETSQLVSRQSDVCFKCPPGGVCKEKTIVADVNYWGFVDGHIVSFVFCSIGHCCPSAPCASYDACNEGREGKLCTSCKNGYQLSVASDECVLSVDCVEGWIYAVIIVTGLIYVGILLIKVESLSVLEMIYMKVIKSCNGKGQMKSTTHCMQNVNHLSVKYKESGFVDGEKGGQHQNENVPNLKINDIHNGGKQELNSGTTWQIPCDSVEIFHIIVFHLQDTRLFQVRFPDMPTSAFTLGEYKDKIVSFARLDSLAFTNQQACLPDGMTEVTKLFIKISVIPFMICLFLACMFFIKGTRSGPQIKSRLMSSAYTIFLLIVLFSSQQLSTSALNLVNCVDLGSGEYLKIDTTVKCYEWWQWITFAYILLFIFPLWLALFIGSGLLRAGIISVRTFLLGMLFPGPFLLYTMVVIYKERRNETKATCQTITADAILGEVWYSYKPFFSYRYLCWGGLVELRRLTLVIFATLIPKPFAKITCMTLIVIISLCIHIRFHPYSDRTANASANVSLLATVLVGMLNFGWASLLYTGSGFDYGFAHTIGQGFATLEAALAEMVPLGIFLFCCGLTLWVNLSRTAETDALK